MHSNISPSDNPRRWTILPFFLIIIVAANIGLFTYVFVDLSSQFLSLREQIKENRKEIQLLEKQIQNIFYINSSDNFSNAKVFDLLKDSVVLIKTKVRTLSGLQDYAQGSGFIYDNEGLIVTNNHVVESAAEISVVFTSGNISKATLVGADPYSDLAVIRVNALQEVLQPVILGNSSSLIIGEPIVAIGNPFGLSGTITFGIVSQVGRELSAPGGYKIVDVIQLDAPINPGNSGGPLVNMIAQVVGINTAIVSGSTGVGFAIPSDTIKREVSSLIATGRYMHPWLGFSGYDIDSDIAKIIGLNYTYGILISDLIRNGPAEKAGLKSGSITTTIGGATYKIGGDLIIGLDYLKIRNFNDLSVYLERNKRPGEEVAITIVRNDQKLTIPVILGERPLP